MGATDRRAPSAAIATSTSCGTPWRSTRWIPAGSTSGRPADRSMPLPMPVTVGSPSCETCRRCCPWRCRRCRDPCRPARPSSDPRRRQGRGGARGARTGYPAGRARHTGSPLPRSAGNHPRPDHPCAGGRSCGSSRARRTFHMIRPMPSCRQRSSPAPSRSSSSVRWPAADQRPRGLGARPTTARSWATEMRLAPLGRRFGPDPAIVRRHHDRPVLAQVLDQLDDDLIRLNVAGGELHLHTPRTRSPAA